jgi:valyl-tRNA synthetase
MPFITEEIWQNLPHEGESIMVSGFPSLEKASPDKTDLRAEEEITRISNIISEIRKIRSEHSINPASKIDVFINPSLKDTAGLIRQNADYIVSLAKIKELKTGVPPDTCAYVKSLKDDCEIYINILDAIDVVQESKRINDEIVKNQAEISKISAKLENPQFIQKAPLQIIEKEKNKLKQAKKAIAVLKQQQNLVSVRQSK